MNKVIPNFFAPGMPPSTIVISTKEPAWEAKVVEIEARFGIARRSPLDPSGLFLLGTRDPVIENGTHIVFGTWPAPALVVEAETAPVAEVEPIDPALDH